MDPDKLKKALDGAWLEDIRKKAPADGPQKGDRVEYSASPLTMGLEGVVTKVYDIKNRHGMGWRYGVDWEDGRKTYEPPVCTGPPGGTPHEETLMRYKPYNQHVLYICPACGRTWRYVDGAGRSLAHELDRNIDAPYSIHITVIKRAEKPKGA